MSVLISLMLSMSVLILYSGIVRILTPGYEAQLARFGNQKKKDKPTNSYERWVRPYAVPLANRVGVLRWLTDYDKVGRRLNYAGNPLKMTPHEFYGVQIYSIFGGFLFGIAWFNFFPIGVALFPIVGFFYPYLWLRSKAQERQRTITNSLPDFIDLFATCVTAGLGSEVAFSLIAKRGEGPLYEELRRLLDELSIGEPREKAFQNMAYRNSSRELQRFIHAVTEGTDLGTPIALILERLSEDMRASRRSRARDAASKLYNKLSVFGAIAVLPTVVLLLAAALLSFMKIWQGFELPQHNL
ncbi:MAG: Pilus assembly protein TadC [Chloroflexi bacterium AL-W]|nr:Pilus assembly protein TadC [Chloroflexi bacterium AL-N1]NOK67778.1 Pilus assembly protein TadC [Chloroflexi bacterium AL-N10]NOK75452.1 Pilus assembly protein TadC [Chloroflexi bacterium AL-N5]NOK82240.1 Pilus assembly protein TadC [Chloroflexi bacterium AL-W]NOK90085.1 Pilus assembly protein TadC [Chloroflexi bacterium AL-N15]